MDIYLKNIGRLSEITLLDISRINYIVGENGSGKSALLAGLFKFDESLRNLAKPSTKYNDYGFLSYLTNDSDSGVNPENTLIEIKFIDSISILSPFFKHDHTNSFRTTSLPLDPLGIKEQIWQDGEVPRQTGLFSYKENLGLRLSKANAIHARAAGNKILVYLEQKLEKVEQEFIKISKNNSKILFIVIDEPETHLHPKWHEKIHEFLERKILQNDKLYFFIATHSSYLIAAAAKKQTNTKVYCLKEGRLITSTAYWTELDDSNNRHTGPQAKGFKPSECKLLVHNILGSTLENYFPKIFCCEESLKCFIETFINTNPELYDMPLILPSGGDNNIIDRASSISIVVESLRHYRLNLLGPSIYGIVDVPNNIRGTEIQSIESTNKNYPGSIIILDETEIEKSYPEKLLDIYLNESGWKVWERNNQSFKTYLKANGLTTDKQIGIEKSNIAKYIGKNIPRDEFTSKFKKIHELLLKE